MNFRVVKIDGKYFPQEKGMFWGWNFIEYAGTERLYFTTDVYAIDYVKRQIEKALEPALEVVWQKMDGKE
jgi:hypothetical protein